MHLQAYDRAGLETCAVTLLNPLEDQDERLKY